MKKREVCKTGLTFRLMHTRAQKRSGGNFIITIIIIITVIILLDQATVPEIVVVLKLVANGLVGMVSIVPLLFRVAGFVRKALVEEGG